MLRYLQGENNISFLDNMSGGAFVCRAHGDHELLFVSEALISIFECDDIDDFNALACGRRFL